MARQATGTVVEHRAKDGRIYRALRFTAYGKRRFVSLGSVTVKQADAELRHVLADVERGTWQPAKVEAPPEPEPLPTFHQLAEQWWLRVEHQLAPKTHEDYRWRLEKHLLKAPGRADARPHHLRHHRAVHRRQACRGALAALGEHDGDARGCHPRQRGRARANRATPPAASAAECANERRGGPTWTRLHRLAHFWTPPVSWTARHRATSATSAAARCSRR
jgi:hypothetical protein